MRFASTVIASKSLHIRVVSGLCQKVGQRVLTKLACSRAVKLTRSAGIVPEILLLLSSKTCSPGASADNDDGMGPDSALPAASRWI